MMMMMKGANNNAKKKKLPPFVSKLYAIVDDPGTDHVISWGTTNDTFIVHRPEELCNEILPTYFKHNNYCSFIRQVNTYGFNKIKTESWEFHNPNFVKGYYYGIFQNLFHITNANAAGQPELLENIARRTAVKRSPDAKDPDAQQSKNKQTKFEMQIEQLEEEKEQLADELAKLRDENVTNEQLVKQCLLELKLARQKQSDMERREAQLLDAVRRLAGMHEHSMRPEDVLSKLDSTTDRTGVRRITVPTPREDAATLVGLSPAAAGIGPSGSSSSGLTGPNSPLLGGVGDGGSGAFPPQNPHFQPAVSDDLEQFMLRLGIDSNGRSTAGSQQSQPPSPFRMQAPSLQKGFSPEVLYEPLAQLRFSPEAAAAGSTPTSSSAPPSPFQMPPPSSPFLTAPASLAKGPQSPSSGAGSTGSPFTNGAPPPVPGSPHGWGITGDFFSSSYTLGSADSEEPFMTPTYQYSEPFKFGESYLSGLIDELPWPEKSASAPNSAPPSPAVHNRSAMGMANGHVIKTEQAEEYSGYSFDSQDHDNDESGSGSGTEAEDPMAPSGDTARGSVMALGNVQPESFFAHSSSCIPSDLTPEVLNDLPPRCEESLRQTSKGYVHHPGDAGGCTGMTEGDGIP